MRRAFSASICCRRCEPRALPWAGMKDTFGVEARGASQTKTNPEAITKPGTPSLAARLVPQRLEINGALDSDVIPRLHIAADKNVRALDSVFMLMYLDFAAGFQEGQQIKDFLFRAAVDQTDGHGGGVLPRALFYVAVV